MEQKWRTDNANDEPAKKKSKWNNPDDSKLKTVGGKITRSSKRKALLDAVERENIEQVDPSVRKSKRLIVKKVSKKKETFTIKSLDTPLLQCLSNSDLTGCLKILKEARHGKCSFTQNTLDTAFISAARQGFLFIMQSLLYLGANIESSDADGNTALILSVERKSVDMVEFLLKKGANAKAVRKSTGDNCLLLAVQPEGLSQIVKLLINHGASIHSQNKNGDTALIRAFNFGNVRVVHLLLKSGADADRCNKFGKTARSMANRVGLSRLLTSMSNIKEEVPALVKAVKMKDIQLLEILLDNKVENVDALYWQSNVSTSALELAFEKVGFKPLPDPATSKMFETMINMLLKEGANVNRNTNSRNIAISPLFVAVTAGRCDLIDLLIQYGANRLSKAFQWALSVGKAECAGLLLDKGAEGNFKKLAFHVVSTREVDSFRFLHDKCQVDASDPRLIHTAVRGGHINMVRLLIELGADVNAWCEGYDPILHHVKDLAMAALLVDNGADVNAVSCSFSSFEYDEVPLTVAIKQSRTDLVKFYLSHGANVSYNLNDRGLPVLQCLCDNPSGELLDLFLAEGMDMDYRNRNGDTTLMWAVKHQKLDLLKLLIDKGADVNLANDKGVSPLMKAVSDCTYGAVAIEWLINAGADVNRLDSCGNSALLYCAKANLNGKKKTLKLLLEKGANVNIQNQDKETVLSVLSFYSSETVKVLLEAGADVNRTDKNGCTPLMNLVCKTRVGQKECLQQFLDHGADVNFVRRLEGYEPDTALSISFWKWIRERSFNYFGTDDGSTIINILEAGADPNIIPHTKSLLHWAILFNQRSIIPTLVTSGLSPYECDDMILRERCGIPLSGYRGLDNTVSPFMLALSLGRLSIAKFLADISFFTEEDIVHGYDWADELREYLRAKGYLQTLAYVDEFISRPRSLTDLSCAVISYNLEDVSDKKRAIMSFELPRSLQDRLLYQHTRGRLESDGIDETSEKERYDVARRYNSEDEDEDDFF